MKKNTYWIVYLIMWILQLLLSNYVRITPYVMITLLPVMVLTIPLRVPSIWAMVIAFATGLSVDFLADGVVGLNALSLVPVAFARNGIISLVFGDEPFERNEDVSVTKNGFGQMSMAVLLALALFLAVYIIADGAGVRPLWFNAARFAASLAAGYVVSVIALDSLAPDTRR